MDTRRLHYFVVVAEERSFSRAASRLGVAQSTLSAGIRTLEQELGGELIRRSSRSVELSAAGTAALPSVLAALRAIEDAGSAVGEVEGRLRGTVRLGIREGLVVDRLPVLLGDFASHNPGLIVETIVSSSATVTFDALIRGTLDLALAPLVGDLPTGLAAESISRDRLHLVVLEGNAIATERVVHAEQLAGLAIVDRGPGDPLRAAVGLLLNGLDVARPAAIEVGDVAGVLDLVRSGFGVTIMPSRTLQVGTGLVSIPIESPHATWTVGLIRSSRLAVGPAVSRLFETLAAGLAA